MRAPDRFKNVFNFYANFAVALIGVAILALGYFCYERGFDGLFESEFITKATDFILRIGVLFGPLLIIPILVEMLKNQGFDLNTLSNDYQGPRENWKTWSQKYFASTAIICSALALGVIASAYFLSGGWYSDGFLAILYVPIYLIVKIAIYPFELFFRSVFSRYNRNRKIKIS